MNFQYALNITGRFSDPADFENIVVKVADEGGGKIVRVRDLGRVELGAAIYGHDATLDGKPSAAIAISQLTGANALKVAGGVDAKMKELAKSFPPGLDYKISFDSTKFVTASIDEVYVTLIVAAALVLIVILLFLQDWRAMLVPATTVPVTIIGAFVAMAMLGFTVNTTSLFALVLAIGIVVDDAIVIVEGVARHIDAGHAEPRGGRQGHVRAVRPDHRHHARAPGGVPARLPRLPGLTGKMYQQFALVIAATALISAVNAVTLKPTQCALWLRKSTPPAEAQPRLSHVQRHL